jgi:hypothetical protein
MADTGTRLDLAATAVARAEEVAEALGAAILMDGGPGIAPAPQALDALPEIATP